VNAAAPTAQGAAARSQGLGLLAGCALVQSLALGLSPIAPAADWPEHLALATQLVRLWSGDPSATARFAVNPATHNAGVHYLVAALGQWIGVDLAGRLVLASYPPLLLGAAALLLRGRGLDGARALALVPAVLGFSLGWGLLNFCLATALGWALVGLVLGQIERPRAWRAALIGAGALLLGFTHVMAMLLTSLVAAVAGAELWWRRGRGLRPLGLVALAGLPLLAGCLYDLRVYALHTAADAGAYVSPIAPEFEPSLLSKLGIFGALLGGMFPGYPDTILCWGIVALLIAGIAGSWRARGGALRGPLLLLVALYLLIPSIFFNTHLVFQRLPQWALVGALLALPAWPGERRWLRAVGLLATLHTALVPVFFGLHARETWGALEVLRALPPGAMVTGLIEEPRTAGIRMHTLSHAPALAVVRGAEDEAYSFARWMGLPVVYRPAGHPLFSAASWEHDARRYEPESALARQYPVVLLRSAQPTEGSEQMALRLVGPRCRVLARSGGWALVDTR
jgi:hypothetical protein